MKRERNNGNQCAFPSPLLGSAAGKWRVGGKQKGAAVAQASAHEVEHATSCFVDELHLIAEILNHLHRTRGTKEPPLQTAEE